MARPPGSRTRLPYEWAADCPCGSRIRVESSTLQPIVDLAAVWRGQHPEGHTTEGP